MNIRGYTTLQFRGREHFHCGERIAKPDGIVPFVPVLPSAGEPVRNTDTSDPCTGTLDRARTILSCVTILSEFK